MLTNENRVIIKYIEPGYDEVSMVDFCNMDAALCFVEANRDIICKLYFGKFYFTGL